jgi:hypothetical protein
MAQQYGFRASRNLSEALDNNACLDNLGIDRKDLPLLDGTSDAGVSPNDYQAIIGLTSNLELQLSTLSGVVVAQSSGVSSKVRKNGDTFTGSIVTDFTNNDRPYVTQSGAIIGPSTVSYFSPASGGAFSSGGEYKLGPVTASTVTTSGFNYTGTVAAWSDRFVQSTTVARLQEQPSWTVRNVPLFLPPPNALDGCVVWLDTEFSAITLASGATSNGYPSGESVVSVWQGVDGDPSARQGDNGDAPTWVPSALGGKPAIRFLGLELDPGPDWMTLGDLGYLTPSGATVVIRTTINNDNTYNIFSTLNNTANSWNTGSGIGNFGVFTTTRQLSFPSGMPSGGTHTFSIRASQSYGLEVRRGGARQDYKASGFTYTGGDTWNMGSSANNSPYYAGDFYAMAVFNRVLSDKEVRTVEEYFTTRFS